VRLSEVHPLLDPTPMPLEVGYERLSDGVLHVANRTDMQDCTGEMFEWWFRFRPDTQQYIWWHPVDHISSHWTEVQQGTHIGSIHVALEEFTGFPAEERSIQFRDPTEFFDAKAYRAARESGAVSAAVCAHSGYSHNPKRNKDGKVLGGRLLHIGRDTPWGLALRSHFYVGQDLAGTITPTEMEQRFPDPFGQALLQHCYNEFTFLSHFLPSLFIAENRKTVKIATPWQLRRNSTERFFSSYILPNIKIETVAQPVSRRQNAIRFAQIRTLSGDRSGFLLRIQRRGCDTQYYCFDR
jgi:hypothetical protein